MAKFGPISWKKFEKFLLEIGCEFVREKGDHRVYSKKGLSRPIVVPRYAAIPIFIIRNNLRVLAIDIDAYLKILDRI